MNTEAVMAQRTYQNVGFDTTPIDRSEFARTIVHLKDHRGWRSTRQEAGSYGRGADMLRVPEQVRPHRTTGRFGDATEDTVVARDFRLVKEALITDHRSGERVREVWYEEA